MNRTKSRALATRLAFAGVCLIAASQTARAGTVEMSFSYQSLSTCTQTLDADDVEGIRGKSCVAQPGITTPGSLSIIFDDTPDSGNTGYADYYIYHDENRKSDFFYVYTDFAAPTTFDHAFKDAFLNENPHYDQLTVDDDAEVANFEHKTGYSYDGDVDGSNSLSLDENPTGSAPSRSAYISTGFDGPGESSSLYNLTYALPDGTPVTDVSALAIGERYVQTTDYYGRYGSSSNLFASTSMDFKTKDDLYKMTVDDLIYILLTDSSLSFSAYWEDYDYTQVTTYEIYEKDGQRWTKYLSGESDYDRAAGQRVSGEVSFDSITVYDDNAQELYSGIPQTYLDNKSYVPLDERSDPNNIVWIETTHNIYDSPAEVGAPPLLALLPLGLMGLAGARHMKLRHWASKLAAAK